ncbi:hypothetical protein C8R46DRAFT_1189505 [Mycena filopes]|nr:hypothetical protein C8R46DRAFT_1189505 [Mycena filopes]
MTPFSSPSPAMIPSPLQLRHNLICSSLLAHLTCLILDLEFDLPMPVPPCAPSKKIQIANQIRDISICNLRVNATFPPSPVTGMTLVKPPSQQFVNQLSKYHCRPLVQSGCYSTPAPHAIAIPAMDIVPVMFNSTVAPLNLAAQTASDLNPPSRFPLLSHKNNVHMRAFPAAVVAITQQYYWRYNLRRAGRQAGQSTRMLLDSLPAWFHMVGCRAGTNRVPWSCILSPIWRPRLAPGGVAWFHMVLSTLGGNEFGTVPWTALFLPDDRTLRIKDPRQWHLGSPSVNSQFTSTCMLGPCVRPLR